MPANRKKNSFNDCFRTHFESFIEETKSKKPIIALIHPLHYLSELPVKANQVAPSKNLKCCRGVLSDSFR